LRQGFFFTGQRVPTTSQARGTDPAGLDPARFVICVQNHDQVGNRADGERLHHQIDAASYRAVCVLLLVAPQTPLLFMGQEWAATSPFLYFTHHHGVLGEQVTAGRRQEFAGFARFAATAALAAIPDPQALATFERSRLPWAEREREPHAGILRLHHRLLSLRASHPALQDAARGGFTVRALDDHTIALTRTNRGHSLLALVRLSSPGTVRLGAEWHDDRAGDVILSTEDRDITVDPLPMLWTPRRIDFARPGAIVVEWRGRGLAPNG
jgi:maltooligosyltrehalose trehalohydrolase